MPAKSRKRSDYSYFLDYRTRWSDNDQYGHVSNTVYNVLIDSITNTYLIEHCGLKPLSSSSILLMVASHCAFVSSCSFPAVLELGLRVNKLGSSSVTYEVGVFEQGIEEVKAVGGYTHVCCDSNTRRPTKMDTMLREGLEKISVESGELARDKMLDSKL